MRDARIFYVYVYFRLSGVPCYVGKGKGERYRGHLVSSKNRHLSRIIAQAKREGKDLPVVILRSGMGEEEAFEMEIAFIKAIGREKDGGPLVNLTDGGEGIRGITNETRQRMRARALANGSKPPSRKGQKDSEETKQKKRLKSLAFGNRPPSAVGRVFSQETRKLLSEKQKKLHADPAYKERMRQRVRAQWADPVMREKMSIAIREAKCRPGL